MAISVCIYERRENIHRMAEAFLFFVDSQEVRLDAATHALEGLAALLGTSLPNLGSAPGVVVFTKRDTPTALPIEDLSAALNPMGWPEVEAVPPQGIGVVEAFRLVVEQLEAKVER